MMRGERLYHGVELVGEHAGDRLRFADLADYYPGAQAVPQTVNGTQPTVPRAAAAAGTAPGAGGIAGSPAVWVLILCGISLALLHTSG